MGTQRKEGLSPEAAEAVVREMAEKHKMKGVLKNLGNFPADRLAKAQTAFAQDMDEEEVALTMVDTSFLHNASAGLLLTNRRIYTSFSVEPIPVEDIRDVTVEKPTVFEYIMFHLFGGLYVMFHGALKTKLFVNGNLVHGGGQNLNYQFWTEMLLELGQVAREEG